MADDPKPQRIGVIISWPEFYLALGDEPRGIMRRIWTCFAAKGFLCRPVSAREWDQIYARFTRNSPLQDVQLRSCESMASMVAAMLAKPASVNYGPQGMIVTQEANAEPKRELHELELETKAQASLIRLRWAKDLTKRKT